MERGMMMMMLRNVSWQRHCENKQNNSPLNFYKHWLWRLLEMSKGVSRCWVQPSKPCFASRRMFASLEQLPNSTWAQNLPFQDSVQKELFPDHFLWDFLYSSNGFPIGLLCFPDVFAVGLLRLVVWRACLPCFILSDGFPSGSLGPKTSRMVE